MNFNCYPAWTSTIRNHYWYLRYARGFDLVKIRKRYRYIASEKKRLQIESVDAELIRLLCRHMVNLKNQKAAERFWNALLKSSPKNLLNLPDNSIINLT
ncbi:conserved protein of unknown function [Candidatus Nitrotoga arctica]|uniref:Transposase n=1 Tax=Candidatus Nitrotoga arctica TaxID=453162 RepID=A0ABN8AJV8_9PROT|nr:conserved protein of unknown function [Candidatus Nitrotoga arctica]